MNAANWKPVPGYEGLYEVSDGGLVRSVVSEKGFRGRHRDGRLLSARANRYGYLCVGLSKRGAMRTCTVHSLVAAAFLVKSTGDQVRHLDGNKLNNTAANLQWGTAKENSEDRDRHGKTSRGERSGVAVLNENIVRTIRALSAAGLGPTEIGRQVGLYKARVNDVVSGRTWRHVR